MRVLPEVAERDEFAALVIRTDYSDCAAWQAVVRDLMRPWGVRGEFQAQVHLVDDMVRSYDHRPDTDLRRRAN
ncbi:DUF6924 domain-containing protein [Streptomyces siamensis]|uniref:DUF6924 domain-containing protein n=1 Tax=Streptomyces siamensis TaxID=1274986 RepID=A0ABP9J2S0_9ACTN